MALPTFTSENVRRLQALDMDRKENIYRIDVYRGLKKQPAPYLITKGEFPTHLDDVRFMRNMTISSAVTCIKMLFADREAGRNAHHRIIAFRYYPNGFLRDETEIAQDLTNPPQQPHIYDSYTNRLVTRPDAYLTMCQNASEMLQHAPNKDTGTSVCVFTQTGDVAFCHDKPDFASRIIQQTAHGLWETLPLVKPVYRHEPPQQLMTIAI